MTLSPDQLQQIKLKFDEQFDDEEKRQVLDTLTGKEEKPTAELDESSKFLLSMVTGDDKKAADDQAIVTLTNLMQGTPDTPPADDDAVKRLTSLAEGK